MGYPANLFGLFTPPFQRQCGSQGEHRQEQHATGGGPHRRTAKASPGTKEKALSPRQGALSRPSLGLGNGLLDNLPGELPDLFHLFPGIFGEGDFIQGRHLKQSLLKDRREEKVDSLPFHKQPSILIEGTLPANDKTLLVHGIFLHLHRPFGFLAPVPLDLQQENPSTSSSVLPVILSPGCTFFQGVPCFMRMPRIFSRLTYT